MSGSALPPIPPDVALITGPTMLGILLNWGFMGVLCVQIYYYHLTFPNDNKYIKSLVYGLFVLDLIQTGLVTADAWHWFVFGFGNMNLLDDTFLNSWDVPMLDSIISLIVQGFYCWRIHIIRQKEVLIPSVIFLISVTQCVAGIVTAVNAHKLGKLHLISTEVVEQTMWLVGSTLADVLITITLAWTLMRSRRSEIPSSNRMLSRIVRLTVETNSLTAGVAIISLILFLGFPSHATLVVPPTAVIGKLYTNCLVAVFNHRKLGTEGSRHGTGNVYSSNLASSGTTSIHPVQASKDSGHIKIRVMHEVGNDTENGNIEMRKF